MRIAGPRFDFTGKIMTSGLTNDLPEVEDHAVLFHEDILAPYPVNNYVKKVPNGFLVFIIQPAHNTLY